ncbi:MAG: hypothetical protein A2Z30_07380 [Chloroflexi bacterium RBG_16_64_43]|nr:MAG: hypothetical protein A2Z30_07380 [Chloroflexi bacterium RBG_16_64_43]
MSNVDTAPFRHAYLDPKVALFTLLLSKRAQAVLRKMMDDVGFPGATDPSALSFLAAYARVRQPTQLLELGTHIGFSTVVLGDVLAGNSQPGRLIAVDPARDTMAKAAEFVRLAQLDSTVTFIPGRSIDTEVVAILEERGPYEMIYVDSSHAYRETLEELRILWGSSNITGVGTCMWFHDAGRAAAMYDTRGEGGVRRALDEWMNAEQGRYQLLVLEPPLWPNSTGLGMMRRVGDAPSA